MLSHLLDGSLLSQDRVIGIQFAVSVFMTFLYSTVLFRNKYGILDAVFHLLPKSKK